MELSHPLDAEPDATLAAWVLQGVQPWTSADEVLPVACFVPEDLPAVARVLHPWTAEADDRLTTWAAVAGGGDIRHLLALARTRDGNDPPHADGHRSPEVGRLDPATAAALVEVLAASTTTPDDVCVAVWTGWEDIPAEQVAGAAAIPTEARGHHLLRGPLTGVLEPIAPGARGQLPAGIWWPADRAWVVTSEIDFEWTLVAGSDALVEALLAHPGLEVLRTSMWAPANRLDGDHPA